MFQTSDHVAVAHMLIDHYAPLFYWSIVESNTGVLSACLPTLRPLLEAYSLSSILAKATKPLSGRVRHSSNHSRLNSLEHGLSEGETSDIRHSGSFAKFDDSQRVLAVPIAMYTSRYADNDSTSTISPPCSKH